MELKKHLQFKQVEIRVVVSPEEIDDLKSYRLARDIKDQIEEELQYPGHIKVTVVRETESSRICKIILEPLTGKSVSGFMLESKIQV